MVFVFPQKPMVMPAHIPRAKKCEVGTNIQDFMPRNGNNEKSMEKTKQDQVWTKKIESGYDLEKDESVSMPVSEYDQFLPGKHYSQKDYIALNSWLFPTAGIEKDMTKKVDESFECNPYQQIRTLKNKLEECEQTLDCLETEHDAQNGKDKFVFFGLVGVATLVLALYLTR